MLEWFKNLVNEEPSPEAVEVASFLLEELTGRKVPCPFSAHVKKHGVVTRVFDGTRTDN